jgi:hypothetical protein
VPLHWLQTSSELALLPVVNCALPVPYGLSIRVQLCAATVAVSLSFDVMYLVHAGLCMEWVGNASCAHSMMVWARVFLRTFWVAVAECKGMLPAIIGPGLSS